MKIISEPPNQRQWKAKINAVIDYQEPRSYLKSWSHEGPLRLQRAFYPEGPGVCHLTLLHPPGGIVSGDRLSINFELSKQSHSLITTPSAGKFYHADQQASAQTQLSSVKLGSDATLEWFPQENIFFAGANAILDNQFFVPAGAILMGWDINCLGRPAAGEIFNAGCFRQRLQIWRATHDSASSLKPDNLEGDIQKPIYIENNLFEGGSTVLRTKAGLQSFPLFGTFFATVQTQCLEDIRNCLSPTSKTRISPTQISQTQSKQHYLASASQLPELLVCRYLGYSAEHVKALFTQVWDILRQEQLNKPACRPRIWDT